MKNKNYFLCFAFLILILLLTSTYFFIAKKSIESPPSLEISEKTAFIAKKENAGFTFESEDIKEENSTPISKKNIYFYAEKDITGTDIIDNIDPRIITIDAEGNTSYGDLNEKLQIQFVNYNTSEKKFKLYPIGKYKNSKLAEELSKEEFEDYIIPAGTVFILFSSVDFGYYDGIKPVSVTPSENIIEIDTLSVGWHPLAVKNQNELKNIKEECFYGISSIFIYQGVNADPEFVKTSSDLSDTQLEAGNHFVWIKKNNLPGECKPLTINYGTEEEINDNSEENNSEENNSEENNETEEAETEDEVCYEDDNSKTICFPSENIGELFDNKSKVYTTAGISICNENRHMSEDSTFKMNDKIYYCDSNQMWNICSIDNEFTISGDNERVCIKSFSEAFGNSIYWGRCTHNNLNKIIDEAEKYCSVDGTWQDVADCEEQVTIDDELYCLQSENCSSEEDNGKTFDNNSKLCKSFAEIECNEAYDKYFAEQINYDQSYYCDSENYKWEACSAQTEFEVSNDHKAVCMGRTLPDGSTIIMEWQDCFFSKDMGKEIIEEAGVYCDVKNKWEDLQNCENEITKYSNQYCVSDDWINNCYSDTDLGKIFDNDSKLCMSLSVDECNETYNQPFPNFPTSFNKESYYCDSENSRWEICSIDSEFAMSNDDKYICIKQGSMYGEYMTWENCTSVIDGVHISNFCEAYR